MPPRNSFALICLIALLGSAPRPWASPGGDAPLRLRVEAGQALALGPAGPRQVFAGEGEFELAGIGAVEVPPGSSASLRWPGRASARLEGPAAISFAPGTGPHTTRWSLEGGGVFELEVRSGRVGAELAPGWRASLEGGAWRLAGLPDGSVRLLHRAGAPAELLWTGPRGQVLPPMALRAGEEIRLGRGAPAGLRPEPPRRPQPWGAVGAVSPWKAPSADLPRLAAAHPGAATAPAGIGAWPWPLLGDACTGADSAPAEAGEARPVGEDHGQGHDAEPAAATSSAPEGPRGEGLGNAASPEEPAAERADSPQRAAPAQRGPSAGAGTGSPAPSSIARGHGQRPWRGLAPGELSSRGELVHQRSAYLRFEPRPGGAVLVLLDPAAPQGVWLFAPRRDYQLVPGSALLLDPNCELRAQTGRVAAFDVGPR